MAEESNKALFDLLVDQAGMMKRKNLRIAVFGPSGVGKSTLLNMFANCAYYASYQEAVNNKSMVYVVNNHFSYTPEHSNDSVDIYLPDESSNQSDTNSSAFSQTKTFHGYEFSLRSIDGAPITVTFLDSPGTMHIEKDEKPKDRDDEYINMVVDYLSTYETIDAFLILLKADSEKLTPEFEYCINPIFNQLDKSAKENIVFGFTGCGPHGFSAPNAENVLKLLGYELKDNRFYFDNTPVRELSVLQNGKHPRQESTEMNAYWKKTTEEFVRMLKHISTLPPYEVQNMATIQDTRYKIKMLVPYLVQCTIDADFTMKEIEEVKKDPNKVKFKEKITKPEILPNRRVVCTNKDCSKEVIEKTGTVETRREEFKQWCCKKCWLKLGNEHCPDRFFIKLCRNMGFSGKCKICSHPVTEHMQITYLMVHQVHLKDAVQDELQKKYELLAYEKQVLLNSCETLNSFLEEHAFNFSENPYLKAIKRVIKKSMKKITQDNVEEEQPALPSIKKPEEKIKEDNVEEEQPALPSIKKPEEKIKEDNVEKEQAALQVALNLQKSYWKQNYQPLEKVGKDDIERVFERLKNLKRIGDYLKEFCTNIEDNQKADQNASKKKFHSHYLKDDLPKLSLEKGIKQLGLKENSDSL